jgi:pimeloyl-ACP methyl ester carboxylesterase
VLLLAGYGCDHAIWMLAGQQLAQQFAVILLDNRGIGQSTGADGAISIHQMAADAAGLIQHLGLEAVHVAGHSMGGMIAQELALTRPELARSLVLVSTCTHQTGRGRAILRSWGELPDLVNVETATRLILPWIYSDAFYDSPDLLEGLIALILANPNPPAPELLRKQARAIVDFDSRSRVKSIRCPTLVLVGEQDILLTPRGSEELSRAIPGAEFRMVVGTGHGLLLEMPQEVARAITNFLSNPPGRREGARHGL